jgi:HSP20 family protein
MAERQTEQKQRDQTTENGPQTTGRSAGAESGQAMTRGARQERPQTGGLERYGDAQYGRSFSPFRLMRRMMEDMDRMYDELGFGAGLFRSSAALDPLRSWAGSARSDLWYPQIEVTEQDGKLLVKADLPGMSKDDVRIEVTDEMLTISGERRQERREERGGRDYTERSYGSFTRSIALPPGVNGQECEASFEHGVLEVTVPLPKQAKRAHTLEIRPRSAGSADAQGKAASRSRPS